MTSQGESLSRVGALQASASLTASGTLVASRPTRVTGVQWVGGASAGTLVFLDGGSGGTEKFRIITSAGSGVSYYMQIPGGGVHFGTDVYCAFTNATGCTIFYDAE